MVTDRKRSVVLWCKPLPGTTGRIMWHIEEENWPLCVGGNDQDVASQFSTITGLRVTVKSSTQTTTGEDDE